MLYLVFAGHQQSEALEICGRLRAAHLRNGLLPVLGEIPQQCANHRLAQLVTRAPQSSGRVSTVPLPEATLGNWCWIEGGDERNWNQQIFARVPPEGCHGGDSLIRIDQNGIEGEGSCTFGKIEQTGPNDFLIYTYCDDDTNGSTRFEIIDGRLVITAL